MGRKGRHPFFESVEITDVAAEGKSIAHVDGKVIFVTGVIPGDIVDIQVVKKKKSYLEAVPVRFVTYSKDRIDAFCNHFGTCGGCKWQMLPYDKQLYFKQKQVVDNFERIGKIIPEEILPILGSEKQTHYRNKLEFTFTNKRWLSKDELGEEHSAKSLSGLGFHVPKYWDKVLDIEKCYLQEEPSNRIRNNLRNYALSKGYTFFDLRKKEGLLRNLIIRISSIGEIMVILVLFEDDFEAIEDLLNFLKDKFPEITSLHYIINQKPNDSVLDQAVHLFAGRDHIFEEMEGLRFKIGPKSFYQTNSLQAYVLYSMVREFAGLSGKEIVYDLYTGTGTIANFLARRAKAVVGIESVPEAIDDAKENSIINLIENTTFAVGDMKDILTEEFVKIYGKPDVVVTDPPRAGMHENVIETIIKVLPQRIIYVSCNPATQARDISRLSEYYAVAKINPVDMFPHTHHVENVALLIRK